MTDRPDLETLGAELQRDLRLQDWRVRYLYVRDLRADQFSAWAEGRPADGAVVYGLCDRLVDNKTATILIRDPIDPLPDGAEPKTPEETLVHELVHLHMAPLAENTPAGVAAEEQAVWPLADEIARLRKTNQGAPRAEMIARAMRAAPGPQTVAPATTKEKRSMSMKKAHAMLRAAMEADGIKEESATYKALAALMDDGDGDEKPKEARAEAAEEKPREARAAEPAKDEPKEQRAADCQPKAAAQVITMADVEAVAARAARTTVSEHAERAQLIESNRDVLGDAERAFYASQPLSIVKAAVMARRTDNPRPAPKPEARAARAGVGPVRVTPGGRASLVDLSHLTPRDQEDTARALRIVSRKFGTAEDQTPPPIEIDARGMRISNVSSLSLDDFLKQQQAAAAGGR